MTTNARTIQAARFSGLNLAGENSDREPIWLGSKEAWELFDRILSV